jgi:hypothetical protein
MQLAALVLALGGEAVTSDSKGLDIVSFVSIVGGYVVLAALWFFVFRDRSSRNTKRKKDPQE